MLISGFFFLFVACIVYTHADVSISKSSASYLAKVQWEEVIKLCHLQNLVFAMYYGTYTVDFCFTIQVQATIQQVHKIINRCLTTHDKLEASLRDLSRTGDVQACKATRKSVDSSLKELTKELKSPVAFLQSSPQATQILPKVMLELHKKINLKR